MPNLLQLVIENGLPSINSNAWKVIRHSLELLQVHGSVDPEAIPHIKKHCRALKSILIRPRYSFNGCAPVFDQILSYEAQIELAYSVSHWRQTDRIN